MYSIKTWLGETSHPVLRQGLPYALAWAIATRAAYAKAQVIDEEFGCVVLETRSADALPRPRRTP